MAEENRLIQERVRKLNELKELGVNPYPHKFNVTKKSSAIKSEYSSLESEAHVDDIVSVAGRIMLMRNMGKASFLTIQDGEGQVQIYLRSDDVGADTYKLLKKLDIGDIIGVTGSIFKTRMGEVTVHAKEYVILCKAINPLPEKFHGVKDTEIKYRKRHFDLIMNKDSKEIFEKRLRILQAIREFMIQRGFLEVETPILQTQYGGASAKPFVTYLN